MQETQVQSLGWEAPLEKEMATHSSTLAWKIPWAEEPGGLQSWDHKESDMTEQLHFVLHFNIWKLVYIINCVNIKMKKSYKNLSRLKTNL